METKKILGQLSPAATTLTTLYEVPGAKGAVISSLIVCNRTASAVNFRVAVLAGGDTVGNKNYIYYDVACAANGTFAAVLGITLSNADKVQVYNTTADLSFSLFGVEFDQTSIYFA